jgi:hypothetical protein
MNLPKCASCKFARNPCPIHPLDVHGDDCLDFRLQYKMDFTPTLTRNEQWQLLNTHPIFTDKCPQCDSVYESLDSCSAWIVQTDWICPICDWKP